jgi:hypothetical protein
MESPGNGESGYMGSSEEFVAEQLRGKTFLTAPR